MRIMYEFMLEKGKMSKQCAAFLTAALLIVTISLLVMVAVSVLGLWQYADTIISLAILISGLASMIWMLNL